jgi:hypothetical protein
MMVVALPDTKSGMRRRPHAGLRFRENATGAVNDLASIWEDDAAIHANAVISLGTRPVGEKIDAINAPCDAAQLSQQTSSTSRQREKA